MKETKIEWTFGLERKGWEYANNTPQYMTTEKKDVMSKDATFDKWIDVTLQGSRQRRNREFLRK